MLFKICLNILCLKRKTQTERFLEGIIGECSSDANVTSRKSKVVEGLKKASCYIDHEGAR